MGTLAGRWVRAIIGATLVAGSMGGVLLALPGTAGAARNVSTWTGLVAAVTTSGPITLTANIYAPSGDHLVVASGTTIDLDLNGHPLEITAPSDAAAIDVTGSLTLTTGQGAGALLVATGNGYGAGIQITNGTLTVSGGTVVATGAYYAAGIGGSYDAPGGTLTIKGGEVTSTGGYDSAGIGGGEGGAGGHITITGGVVVATGGTNGAGIGGGVYDGTSGTVTITGGTVDATGGASAAGIGGGYYGPGGEVSITGGTVDATAGSTGSAVGAGSGGSSFGSLVNSGALTLEGHDENLLGSSASNTSTGTVTLDTPLTGGGTLVNTGTVLLGSGGTVTGVTVTEHDYVVTFTVSRIKGTTKPTSVTVYAPSFTAGHATLPSPPPGDEWAVNPTSNLQVTPTTDLTNLFGESASGPTSVTVYLVVDLWTALVTGFSRSGTVTLKGNAAAPPAADLVVGSGTTVTLDLDGHTLTIGSPPSTQAAIAVSGSLTIVTDAGGTGALTVTGGLLGAGIGGDRGASGGNVTIDSGTVSATGGTFSAGIGGGFSGSGGTVTIKGGTVSATGGTSSAGIGGGFSGSGGTVTINGGTVTATGGSGGAGIGGGSTGSGGTVTIKGGTVSATGGTSSAGIGGGSTGSGGTVTIKGGTVTATGAPGAAGIGGGSTGSGGKVAIDGGAAVTATGGSGASAIGAGGTGTGGTSLSFGSLTNGGALTLAGHGEHVPAGSSVTNTQTGLITLDTQLNGGGKLKNTGTVVLGGGGSLTTVTVTEHDYSVRFTMNGAPGTAPAPQAVYASSFGAGRVSPPTPPPGYAWETEASDGTPVTATTNLTALYGASAAGATPVTFYLVYTESTQWADLLTAVQHSGSVVLSTTINAPLGNALTVPAGVTVVLQLNDHGLTIAHPTTGDAGIEVDGSLTIATDAGGDGTVTATGSMSAAGIGGGGGRPSGTTTIEGGTVHATGGYGAAGIGGGETAAEGPIIIDGGTVDATGGTAGAGIGSGAYDFSAGTVIIRGGVVHSVGGTYGGAGIGGGYDDGPGSSVTIEDATVTTTGGVLGAGIGGGWNGFGQSVTIENANVNATGGTRGAGIGGAYGGHTGEGVTISSGSSVTATGGYLASAIGTGYSDSSFGSLTNNGTLTLAGYGEDIPSGTSATNGTTGLITLGTQLYGGGKVKNAGAIAIGTGGAVTDVTVTDHDYVVSYTANGVEANPAPKTVYATSFTKDAVTLPVPPSGFEWASKPDGGKVVTAGADLTTLFGESATGATEVTLYLVQVKVAPSFTSSSTAYFMVKKAGTFTIVTSGTPTARLSKSGMLPKGLTFKVTSIAGTATISGTATVAGTTTITVTAKNGVAPKAIQQLTIVVGSVPKLTSVDAATFTVGTSGTFAVTTDGVPAASLSTSTLPMGLTFETKGNGSGTISGDPAATTSGVHHVTITASNHFGQSTQALTITVDDAPAFTSTASTTFKPNDADTFTVKTSGYPAATLTEVGTLPNGVTFTKNAKGTATLSGTPTTAKKTVYALKLTATNGVGSPVVQTFKLTVS